MTNQLPPALHELIVDSETNWVRQQLLSHVRALEVQGVTHRAIGRALARVLFEFTLEQYNKWGPHRIWAKRFLCETGKSLIEEGEAIGRAERMVVACQTVLKEADPMGSA